VLSESTVYYIGIFDNNSNYKDIYEKVPIHCRNRFRLFCFRTELSYSIITCFYAIYWKCSILFSRYIIFCLHRVEPAWRVCWCHNSYNFIRHISRYMIQIFKSYDFRYYNVMVDSLPYVIHVLIFLDVTLCYISYSIFSIADSIGNPCMPSLHIYICNRAY
jgi:hypothetical protein